MSSSLLQFINDNPDIFVIENGDSIKTRAELSSNISSKIVKKKEQINNIGKEITANIIAQSNEIPTNSVSDPFNPSPDNIIKNQQAQQQNISQFLENLAKENSITSAASRIEYRVAKAIDSLFSNSTPKEIYNYNKDPQAAAEKINVYDILLEEAQRDIDLLNFVNRPNS